MLFAAGLMLGCMLRLWRCRKMLDPIQLILAIVDAIARLAIEAKKEARYHVKTASLEGKRAFPPAVWRAIPVPDV